MIKVALDGEVVALGDDEIAQLLEALTRLELRAAESIADQIAALRLAGGTIDLSPTEAELDALRQAAGTLADTGAAAARLAALCGAGEHAVEVGAA